MIGFAKRAAARFKQDWAVRRFLSRTKGILRTPPIHVVPGEPPLRIVTMLCEKDVQTYLICIKALYRRLRFGAIEIILDQDVSLSSRALLQAHIKGVELTSVWDIDPAPCQRGGTWERLVHCIKRSSQEFVVQMDADVLIFGDDTEIQDSIIKNRAFAIRSPMDRMPLQDYAQLASAMDDDHINIAAERAMAGLLNADKLHYIRATSGFAGYPRNAISLAAVQQYHGEMETLLGPRWRDWGSEQVASNFLIANAPMFAPLPWDAYANYWPASQVPQDPYKSSGLHFVGTYRYHGDVFLDLAKREIAQLLQPSSP